MDTVVILRYIDIHCCDIKSVIYNYFNTNCESSDKPNKWIDKMCFVHHMAAI